MISSHTESFRDESVGSILDRLVTERFASRLFAKDTSLWGAAAQAEAAIRLGWTDFADAARVAAHTAIELRSELAAEGVDRFVLCGMGGSSLAPLVISDSLTVLDSTHPETVRAALAGDLSRTAVIVSSKSGATIETLSHRAVFEDAFAAAGIEAAARVIVITDPGSDLEAYARATGMRTFLADPNVGGRFSALTAFGIVPSVLAGTDVEPIISAAEHAREAFATDTVDNPALKLAAAIASGLPERFMLEVSCAPRFPQHFGLWVEQLVAESTGKDGRGILPIARSVQDIEAAIITDVRDSVSPVRVGLAEPETDTTAAVETQQGDASLITVTGPLGAQFLLWEVATAALGFVLHVDPFNQPDVEAAKIAARDMLRARTPASAAPLSPTQVWESMTAGAADSSYVAVQAYADAHDESLATICAELCDELAATLGMPVAFGWGPRYLHSTGQLHKGGPAAGVFLQLVDSGYEDLAIPLSDASFGELLGAQAQGDAVVLRERGRTVVTVSSSDMKTTVRSLLNH